MCFISLLYIPFYCDGQLTFMIKEIPVRSRDQDPGTPVVELLSLCNFIPEHKGHLGHVEVTIHGPRIVTVRSTLR